MFTGIDREICQRAWSIVLPSVWAARDDGVTNKHAGTIIVLDPSTGEVLFQARVTMDHPEAEKYDEIALAKADLSWRNKRPSREIQQAAPHLYVAGDTKWGGSVVRDGLVVAFSGVQAVFDEMIAGWVADAIIAICRDAMTKADGVMASDSSYIGGASPKDIAMAFDAAGSEVEQHMANATDCLCPVCASQG